MKNIFLLDMDDTLLDFQTLEHETILNTLKNFSLRADEDAAKAFHDINDGLWKALERGEIVRERIVTKRFELLLEYLGQTADIERISKTYFRGLVEGCYPFEGMIAFLQALSKKGEIYITTNGAEEVQRRHLQDANILPFVQDVFISDCVGHNKPSFEYVQYVEEHIPRFIRQNAVCLGDSVTSDKLCAERLGIDFILYAPRRKPISYQGLCARTYDEVLRLIDKM